MLRGVQVVLRALLLCALTAAGSLGVAGAASADEPRPLRFLFTGDSITHGFTGDYSYRLRIAQELDRQGVAYDFVGSRHDPYVRKGEVLSEYLTPFDSDHFALGATRLGAEVDRIDDEVTAQQPDVVVAMLGLNDLRDVREPVVVADRLRRWIAAVRSAKPDTALVLAQVLPVRSEVSPWLREQIPAYNTLLQKAAVDLTTDVSPIHVAPTARGWDQDPHAYDGIHPNPTGETLIAQRICETFHAMGALPSAPSVYRWTSWRRDLRPVVEVKGDRAIVSWDHRALTGVHLWSRRVGRAASLDSTLHKGRSLSTGPLSPGAQYEFRLQAVRGRTTSPVGPSTVVSVPPEPRSVEPISVTPPRAVGRVRITRQAVRWSRSARASTYVVKVRRAGSRQWYTKRTTGSRLAVRGVARAKVWAVNAGGRSASRTGRS